MVKILEDHNAQYYGNDKQQHKIFFSRNQYHHVI